MLQLVAQPQLLLEQEGAVERLVGLLHLGQQRQLPRSLLRRRLEQRPAGALDPLAGLRMRALVRVPLISADLVHGALGQAHDVERVDRDLGVGQALADRLLIAAGHVDRDGADRALALAEPREEAPLGPALASW